MFSMLSVNNYKRCLSIQSLLFVWTVTRDTRSGMVVLLLKPGSEEYSVYYSAIPYIAVQRLPRKNTLSVGKTQELK
jgi:hypothetical protein